MINSSSLRKIEIAGILEVRPKYSCPIYLRMITDRSGYCVRMNMNRNFQLFELHSLRDSDNNMIQITCFLSFTLQITISQI